MFCVRKNPRIVKCAAPDAHAGATGPVYHDLRRFGRDYVAVPNHRNPSDGLHHRGNPLKIDAASKTLLARASMNENRRHTHVFEGASQLRGGDIFIIPAQPHFGRDGNFHRLHHAFHQSRGFLVLGHHGRAAPHPTDLPHWATHIDVHRRDAECLKTNSSIAHFLGHRPEQLHRQRTVRGTSLDQFQCFGIFFQQ